MTTTRATAIRAIVEANPDQRLRAVYFDQYGCVLRIEWYGGTECENIDVTLLGERGEDSGATWESVQ